MSAAIKAYENMEDVTVRQIATIIATFALLVGVSAVAQESRSEISLQGTGFFTKDATGQGITQRSTNTGGFLVGYRYHFNRWLATEAVYGYDRHTQQFFLPQDSREFKPMFIRQRAASSSAFQHLRGSGLVHMCWQKEVRWSLIPLATHSGRFQARNVKPLVCLHTGGADFPILRHVSLRAEYRGLVYSAPDFGVAGLNTNTVNHTAQPSAGIVFRF